MGNEWLIISAVAAILSLGAALYAARRQQVVVAQSRARSGNPDQEPTNQFWLIMSAVWTIVFILAIGAVIWYFAQEETRVSIVAPVPDALVGDVEGGEGQSKNVPDGNTIWVVVVPAPGGRYYPQGEPIVNIADGQWETAALFQNEAGEPGSFEILAVVADHDAHDQLHEATTLAELGELGPALEELPDGAKVYDRITVFRR